MVALYVKVKKNEAYLSKVPDRVPLTDFDMSLPINTQIDDVQRLTCGAGGTHRVVGSR